MTEDNEIPLVGSCIEELAEVGAPYGLSSPRHLSLSLYLTLSLSSVSLSLFLSNQSYQKDAGKGDYCYGDVPWIGVLKHPL